MSGIAVVFNRDREPVQPKAMRAMVDAVPHLGLDGTCVRVWPGAGVGMGYAKLAITPEDRDEQQPVVSPRTGSVLIADVRLDNRSELLACLPEGLPSSASDGELILRAYEVWGADMPRRLLGDFAVIVWDPRNEQLLLARDATGQRPLFFRDDGRTFAAASELHQLLQDPSVPVVPNESRIRDYLIPVNVFRNSKEQEETFYAGIYTLPSAETMLVRRSGIQRHRYWHFNPKYELRYRHDEDYAEHFRSVFFEAVQARLRSSGPVAASLSGGIDSTSIVSAAQALYRAGRTAEHGFTTFSMVFEGLECDERPIIETTRAELGLDARFVSIGHSAGVVHSKPQQFAEEPQGGFGSDGDPLIRAVYERGARVLLTGDIADAYVGGSRLVFDSLLRQGHFRDLLCDFATYRRLADESLAKTLALWCLAPMLPLALHRHVAMAYTRRFITAHWHELVPSWLADNFQDDLRQRHLQVSVDMERRRRFSSPAREDAYDMLCPPLVVRDYTGWPVQVWRPYGDRRLQEFMLGVPPEHHFRAHPETDQYYAGSKRLVRAGLRGIMPEAVRTSVVKTGFGSVFTSDLERSWPMYQATFGPAARPLVAERGYINRARFWARLEQLRGGIRGADFIYLIRVMGLEAWLQGFEQPRAMQVHVSSAWRHQTLAHTAARGPEVLVGTR